MQGFLGQGDNGGGFQAGLPLTWPSDQTRGHFWPVLDFTLTGTMESLGSWSPASVRPLICMLCLYLLHLFDSSLFHPSPCSLGECEAFQGNWLHASCGPYMPYAQTGPTRIYALFSNREPDFCFEGSFLFYIINSWHSSCKTTLLVSCKSHWSRFIS